WVQYVLKRDLRQPPGTAFNYSTGDSQLLAAALQQITAMTLLDYADLYLFGPLGITQRAWPADPQGVTIGGAELQITPRDMAKLGFLWLNRGRWGDDPARDQIVPAAWIAEASTYHTLFEPRHENDCATLGYGYLFWLRPQGEYDSFIAVGYGGQFVYMIPGLDMVVVMTGDLDGLPDAFRNNQMLCQFNLVEEFIVPAAQTPGA
ncbi:MAG: serine hydrolase, partial [Anaerolineae bacterium]|nr:serine hydrolase [Anaerolineae bacterium]